MSEAPISESSKSDVCSEPLDMEHFRNVHKSAYGFNPRSYPKTKAEYDQRIKSMDAHFKEEQEAIRKRVADCNHDFKPYFGSVLACSGCGATTTVSMDGKSKPIDLPLD